MQREQVAQTAYGQNKPAGQLPIETQPGLRLASHPDGSFSASPNPNAGGYYSQSGHVLPEVLVTADRNGDWVFPDYLTQGILQPQWQEGGWQPRPGVINPDDIRALDDTLSRFSQQTRRFSQRYDDWVMGHDGHLSPSQAAAAAFAKGPLEILNNTAGGLADTTRLFTSPEARSKTWQALSNPMDTAEAIWDSLQGLSGRDAGLLAVELATGGLVTRSVARLGSAGELATDRTLERVLPEQGVVPDSADALAARRAYLNEKHGRTGDINADINIRERKVLARGFYEEAGFSGRPLENHLKGIDYSQDVDIYTFSRGRPVAQWQPPDTPVGNYFSRIGGDPTRMGIDAEDRQLLIYAPAQRTTVLRSTAADIPSWKGDGRTYFGGETQYFTKDPQAFRLYDRGL